MASTAAISTSEFMYVTYIATTPEKLWAALTDPDLTQQYFFGARVESDWQVGSTISYVNEDGSVEIEGEILKCEAPKLLSYIFTAPEHDVPREQSTVVTFELKQTGSSVRLTLRHDNLLPKDLEDSPDTFEGVNNGWPAIISGLKSVLETGRGCVEW
jgi:uncharacterized protein YndB with AHSA1/START domain